MWKNYQNCHENKLCYSNYTLPKCVHCLTLNAPVTLSLCVCHQGRVFFGTPLFAV